MVILYSGLAGDYERDEVDAVLAHELGHVLSEHYYYTTAFVLLAQFLRTSVPGGLDGAARSARSTTCCSSGRAPPSCPRTARARSSWATRSSTCRMLMRMAGGSLEGMNLDAFITQATEYEDEEDLFARWSPRVGGDRPHAPVRGAPRPRAHRVGRVGRVRPDPRRQLRAAGPRAAARPRSSRPPSRTTASGSPDARANDRRRAAPHQPARGVAATAGAGPNDSPDDAGEPG